MESITLIGAGRVAQALGDSLHRAGHSVRFGVREPGRDRGELPGPVESVAEAAEHSRILVLAVPAVAAIPSLEPVGSWDGKIVIDCTNPLRWDGGPVWDPPTAGSMAHALAEHYPEARIVKAFNHFGAEIHSNPVASAGRSDALIASDHPEATQEVMSLAERIGFRPLDFGPLRNASVLENLAVAWIHLSSVGGLGRTLALRFDEH